MFLERGVLLEDRRADEGCTRKVGDVESRNNTMFSKVGGKSRRAARRWATVLFNSTNRSAAGI